METALKTNPLHKRQHAYRVGRSTESAISQVLNEIEKGKEKGLHTLTTFIDISSAFDRLNPAKATQALIAKGVNKDIALWYRDYLTERHAHIDIKGCKTVRKLNVGCPQGGVLSTILWNVAFDDLLGLFKYGNIICVGYADDGCLIISSKSISILYRDMNEALAMARNWALSYGLDLSPKKTNYMLFKHDSVKSIKHLIPSSGLQINGKTLERETQVKYLGITIDHQLKWDPHINSKVEAARKLLFKLKAFVGKTWGPCPEMIRYAYISTIRPMIAYSAFAFAGKLTSNHIKKLNKIQLLALRMTCNARRGTPLKGMEVILDIPPLDLFLNSRGTKKHPQTHWNVLRGKGPHWPF